LGLIYGKTATGESGSAGRGRDGNFDSAATPDHADTPDIGDWGSADNWILFQLGDGRVIFATGLFNWFWNIMVFVHFRAVFGKSGELVF
jgi:hypothetical protein